MAMSVLACLIIGGVQVATPIASEVEQRYFDEDARFAERDYANALQRSVFEATLTAMGERPLNPDENHEAYRFLWVPSFHDSIAVRLERTVEGAFLEIRVLRGFEIVTTESDGRLADYEPGGLVSTRTVALSEAEWSILMKYIKAAEFWVMPSVEEDKGVDAADWLMEGIAEREHHLVTRWSPLWEHVWETAGLSSDSEALY